MLGLLILVQILTSLNVIIKSFYGNRTHLEFINTCCVDVGPVLLLKLYDVGVARLYDSYLNCLTHMDASSCKTLKALNFFKRMRNECELVYSSNKSISFLIIYEPVSNRLCLKSSGQANLRRPNPRPETRQWFSIILQVFARLESAT